MLRLVILVAYALTLAHAVWSLWTHDPIFFADKAILTFAVVDVLYHANQRRRRTP